MIFRRSNDSAPAKPMVSAQRPQNSAPRREPELTSRAAPVLTPTQMPMTPTQPLSPLAMAQARRTNGAANNPMGHFTRPDQRQEQLRKLTVGRDISLNGEITTCDHLIVEGTVKATIKGGQILEISETGAFSGLVDIEQADIAGTFEGDLIVRGRLSLRPTAVVSGTIRYGSLQVDGGATLTGEIAPLPAAQVTTQAPQTPSYASHSPMTDHTQPANTYDISSMMNQPGFLKASA